MREYMCDCQAVNRQYSAMRLYIASNH